MGDKKTKQNQVAVGLKGSGQCTLSGSSEVRFHGIRKILFHAVDSVVNAVCVCVCVHLVFPV